MKIDDVKSILLIPEFMKSDSTVKGLSAAMDSIISALCSKLYYINLWKHIPVLTSDEMDFVGNTIGIPWYHDSFTLEQKRIVLTVYQTMFYSIGTSGSITTLLDSIYGDANVKEWYDYDGSAFHFKIVTENSTAVNEKAALFLRLLDNVKKATALLDEIEISSSGTNYIYEKVVSIENSYDRKGIKI